MTYGSAEQDARHLVGTAIEIAAELGVEPIIVVEAKCPVVEVNRSSMLRCGNRRYDPWIDIRGSGLQA